MRRIVAICVFLLLSISSMQAQTAERPLILPFQDEAGIDTWLLAQAYGNTIGAYLFGDQWYSAGQGLHFGLDFTAPCGTPLVAVADGTVAFVDNLNFGSAPHNVILRHEALGLTSLYGHLQSRSTLVEGQSITQGDFVGFSGDPDSTCTSRPHLHLEIRTLDYRTALNPVAYIDANWSSLALVGGFSSRSFQMDLDNSRRWQTLDDQPNVAFGGQILNNYTTPYFREDAPPSNPILARETAPITENLPVSLRLFDPTGCCWEQWWHPTEPVRLFTLDGFAEQRAAIYAYDAPSGTLLTSIGTTPPPYLSPDYSHSVRLVNNQVEIQNDVDLWIVQTNLNIPSINTDNTRLLWVEDGGSDIPGQDDPINSVFISDIRGADSQLLFAEQGLSAMWLDADRILLRISDSPFTQFDVYDVRDSSRYTLGRWYRPRGFSIAPGGNRLLFYLPSQPDPQDTGMYWMDIAEGATAQKVDWFGGYRWRDADSVFVVPFNPNTDVHQLLLFDIESNTTRSLTEPSQQPFSIMDGRWSVNADGTHILFRNAQDRNLWFMDIATE